MNSKEDHSTHIINVWLASGISDLFFGFATEEDDRFYNQAMFGLLMGLEKILKAFHMCLEKDQFVGLSQEQATKLAEKIAKGCAHDFSGMINTQKDNLEKNEVNSIERGIYTYKEEDIREGLSKAYMEYRYPTHQPYYKQKKFEVDMNGTKGWSVPFQSSDMRDYPRNIIRIVLRNISREIDLSTMLDNLEKKYGNDNDQLKRFFVFYFGGPIEAFIKSQ